jgi:glycosyltransferase involved in cell wall biosynthesis
VDLIRKKAQEGCGFSDSFQGFRILTVGRLHYQKGYDITIPVLSMLRKRGYPVRWYVLGDGPQRKEVEKWIKDAGAEEDFVLLGAVSNPYPYIKQCDLYVHATRYEGKSIAIEEAQVLGKAVIASDCPGNREQIQDKKNGLLVPLEKEKIAEAIIGLYENEKERKRYEQASLAVNFSAQEQLLEFCSLIESET